MTALVILLSGAGVAYAMWRIGSLLERQCRETAVHGIVATFAPAIAAIQQDPRQVMAWYPLAQTSRKLFPEAFKELDRAAGGAFPFTREFLEAAHARCSSDWLAWERSHDAEFSLRAAQVQDEIGRTGQPTPLLRTRLAAIEQEKLQTYQQRYEEYIKTSKALAAYTERQ